MTFGMLFEKKSNPFLRNTVDENCAINAILTELAKQGCNSFRSYDDVDIDITKLSVQKYLKSLDHNSNP